MRATLLALYELQTIDSQVHAIRKDAEDIPKKIQKREQSLESLRSELGLLNSEVDTLKVEQQEIEAKNSEESGKHRKWKVRLNEIKSPREYQALSREIELGERQVRENDEKLLALMQEIETREATISDKAGVLKSEEQQVNAEVRDLRDAQEMYQTQAREASEGREELVKKVNKRILKRYEQLLGKRDGLAVALVAEGACVGCNMRVRPQQLVEILRFNSIEQCPSCGRILVHEELLKDQQSS